MENTVTINAADYLALQRDSILLSHLYANGVDNWCGWDEALASYDEEIKTMPLQNAGA